MANYYQTTPNQYAEYVPEHNLELYATALAKRDSEYLQGAEKIQSYKDAISGLPVGNDADKKYLQSLTDNLTTETNKMASFDFSDPNVVNKIGSMSAKIYNDPIVQSAIYSASNVRNAVTNLETARTTGKGYSKENEDYLSAQIEEWKKSSKAGTPFNEEYIPYVDVKDKAIKMLKEKHPNIVSTQDPVTGDFTLSYVLKNGSLEQIDPLEVKRLTEGIIASDPTMQRQMDISSWSTYRGFTPELLKEQVGASYKGYIDDIDETIKVYRKKELEFASDPSKLAEIKEAITNLETSKTNYNKEIGRLTKMADTDPDQLKSYFYKENMTNTIANIMGYRKNTESYVENPYFKANLDKIDHEKKWEKWRWDYEVAKQNANNNGTSSSNSGSNQGVVKPYGDGKEAGKVVPAFVETAQTKTPSDIFNTTINNLIKDTYQKQIDMMADMPTTKQFITVINTKNADGSSSTHYDFAGNTPQEKAKNREEAQKEFLRVQDMYLHGAKLPANVETFFEQNINGLQMKSTMQRIVSQAEDEWNQLHPEENSFIALNSTPVQPGMYSTNLPVRRNTNHVNTDRKVISKEKQDFMNQRLSQYVTRTPENGIELDYVKQEDLKAKMSNIYNQVLSTPAGKGIGDVEGILQGKEPITAMYFQPEGKEPYLRVSRIGSSEPAIIPLNETFARTLGLYQDKETRYLEQMLDLGTSTRGGASGTNRAASNMVLGRVGKYYLTYDVKDNNGTFTTSINVIDPATYKRIDIIEAGLEPKKSAKEVLEKLKQIKQDPTTSEYWISQILESQNKTKK